MTTSRARMIFYTVLVFLFIVSAGGVAYFLSRDVSAVHHTGLMVSLGAGLFLVAVLLTVLFELLLRVYHPATPPTIDVIRGTERLVRTYESLREAPHANLIMAIWCTDYGDIDIREYFEREFRALTKRKKLVIRRLINLRAMNQAALETYYEAYREFRSNDPDAATRYHHFPTDVQEFECFIGTYERDGTRESKQALFVYNNPTAGESPLGLFMNSERSEEARDTVDAIKNWFETLIAKGGYEQIDLSEAETGAQSEVGN